MSVHETAAPTTRRRKAAELPELPLKQHTHIFGGDIPKLAAQEGRKSPGKGTIQKLTSRAGRESGRGPKVAGYIGKRPVYTPQWLDSLITPEPRATGITVIGPPVIASIKPIEPAPPVAATPTPIASAPAPKPDRATASVSDTAAASL
jgi:hypothetical protein